MSRAQREAAFRRDEAAGNAAMDLLLELRNAGGWHQARCIPSGRRCTCERPATTTRKAS